MSIATVGSNATVCSVGVVVMGITSARFPQGDLKETEERRESDEFPVNAAAIGDRTGVAAVADV